MANAAVNSPPKAPSRSPEPMKSSPEFSPRAPKCSSRWKELLGFKNARSLKHFLYRNPNPKSSDASLSIPLLRDSDSETPSISSRLSLSSSSSGADHEDFPRLSFDFDKPKLRFTKLKASPFEGSLAAADSPRLNASGKVIFQGLERSSSSPSSFNGRPRIRTRGMERSYSANLRVTPVLNVPVCIGQLFSTQKKEKKGFQQRIWC